jgi:hypothetical protein
VLGSSGRKNWIWWEEDGKPHTMDTVQDGYGYELPLPEEDNLPPSALPTGSRSRVTRKRGAPRIALEVEVCGKRHPVFLQEGKDYCPVQSRTPLGPHQVNVIMGKDYDLLQVVKLIGGEL